MDAPLPENLVQSWADFFSRTQEPTKVNYVFEDIFFDPTIFPLQRIYELGEMMWAASQIDPVVVVEIGADKGGGFYHWCKALPSVKRAIAIEIRGTPYIPLFQENFNNLDILGIPASSYHPNTVRKVVDFLGSDKIDCLFLDGDKASFHADYNQYLPLMSTGGLIFVHDIVDEIKPKHFWESLRTKHRLSCVVDCRDLDEQKQKFKGTSYGGWLEHWGATSCGVGIAYV